MGEIARSKSRIASDLKTRDSNRWRPCDSKQRFETRDWRFVLNTPIQPNCEKGCDLSPRSKIASDFGDWRFCPSKTSSGGSFIVCPSGFFSMLREGSARRRERGGGGGVPFKRRLGLHALLWDRLLPCIQDTKSPQTANPPKITEKIRSPLPRPAPEEKGKITEKGRKLVENYNFLTFSVILIFPFFLRGGG